MTDKKVFNKVFRELRQSGFVARQNYTCCQNCGWHEIYDEYDVNDDSNIVFYHNQDYDAFGHDGNLSDSIYLAWQGDGNKIKEAFERNGFIVDWNGTEEKRICIIPNR